MFFPVIAFLDLKWCNSTCKTPMGRFQVISSVSLLYTWERPRSELKEEFPNRGNSLRGISLLASEKLDGVNDKDINKHIEEETRYYNRIITLHPVGGPGINLAGTFVMLRQKSRQGGRFLGLLTFFQDFTAHLYLLNLVLASPCPLSRKSPGCT